MLRLDQLPHIANAWAYWDRIRASRAMPARADLDPAAIKSILPYVLLVDVEREPLNFRFRLVGTEIHQLVAGNYTGRLFSDLPHMREGSAVWTAYSQVVASGAPLCSEISYVGRDQYVRRMNHALFPLSADGKIVDMIWTVVDVERQR